MRKLTNITLATSRNGKGGVASVVYKLHDSGFFSKWHVKHIVTHVSGNDRFGFLRVMVYLSALIITFFTLVLSHVGIAHIHMSSRGSYKRKALLVKLLRLFKVKIILHLHGAEFKEFYHDESEKKQQIKIAKIFNQVDRVIVLSSQWLQWVSTIIDDSSKIRVIYNSVDSLTFDRESIQPGTILFLGRLGGRKGVADLIQAFYQVHKKVPNSRLILGGDGDLNVFKQQAKELGIEEQVIFLGWVNGQDKLDWLARADVFCLPSYNEGFPMGVLEAMSAQKAIIASRAGGIPDAIEDEKSGLLFDAGDVAELSRLLTLAIDNRSLNTALAKNAKSRFEAKFSAQAIIPQLDALYEELLNEL
ncbi:glycosyltransferase family 4 protein [Pseudoalteromonas sp. MMG010]|uniref:glycosyltransferase family 4 protein n=1 Tax=Pseudoalteromonas sp. MMG010 TaxID=2822685 RepID=UPI001B3A7358|nr:glycosyltransferase family 4 protein [Pseudoalteromonas sp. MMG010]MBQ4834140.1 glycosyltransferase family 4 protein [Pseudoalteromonas sp. MMG010]